MAACTNVFSDTGTNNWFKACLALNVTKEGLANFVGAELQNLHATLGRSCGNCSIENEKKTPMCSACDQVKQKIISNHRYNGPSWRNTNSKNWTSDSWEIGKCYLPPDGYRKVSSVKESDFNGLINILLNCIYFQTCLSSSCLSPAPPDKQCPLEMIREIGRHIRHTSDCKVTDANLQDYFRTLSTLLADPKQLQYDPLATIALTRLSALQNGCMSLKELGDLLKEASQTLHNAKVAQECFSEEAKKTLAEALQKLDVTTNDGEQRLKSKTHVGKQRLEQTTKIGESCLKKKTLEGEQCLERKAQVGEQILQSKTQIGEQCIEQTTKIGKHCLEQKTLEGEQCLERKAQVGEQHLQSKTQIGEQCIEQTTQIGKHCLDQKTLDGEQCLERKVQVGEQLLQSKTQIGEQCIEQTTQIGESCLEQKTLAGEQCLERKVQAGEQLLQSKTQIGEQCLEKQTLDGEQCLERKAQVWEQLLQSTTHVGEQCIEGKIHVGEQCLERKTQDGEQRIESKVLDGILLINTEANKTAQEDYERGVAEMLRGLTTHYKKTLSHVTISPLNDWVQERLDDIYMPPNVKLIENAKGSFEKTEQIITKYIHIFNRKGTLNHPTFMQGEAGAGKSTFLAKIVLDWCSINTTQSLEPLPIAETNNSESFFQDLTSLKSYKFIFLVTLRDSYQQFEIFGMIKKQIIDCIYGGEDDRKNAYKLLNEFMKKERCLVLLDGLDEWTSPMGHNLPTLVAAYSQCDMLITTRPWKLTETKIPDSQIDKMVQLDGVHKPFRVSERILSCRAECKNRKDLEKKLSEFISYIYKNDLYNLLVSPMMLSLIVQSWADGIELKGSRCKMYSLLLESLLKKANSETSEFQQPPFGCFTGTQYIEPNIVQVRRLARAAFCLLFSDKRENSLVFTSTEFKQTKLDKNEDDKERIAFALKSGILTATRKTSYLRSSFSFSFIHKSIQEFLAAYHIANNIHLIDSVISGYLTRHTDAYLAISQVFIFLCGLNILAANKLSVMMNARVLIEDANHEFQSVILSGWREAAENDQTGILLELSKVYIWKGNIRDVQTLWTGLSSNVVSFTVEVNLREASAFVPENDNSNTSGEVLSQIEFDLSTSVKLKYLTIAGSSIWLKDKASSSTSELPVCIVINTAGPTQCSYHPPVLPAIKCIRLQGITCSSTWLHSLLTLILTLDHEVQCEMFDCKTTSCVEGEVHGSSTHTSASIKTLLRFPSNMLNIKIVKLGEWGFFHDLNVNSLSLGIKFRSTQVNNVNSVPQLLSSVEQVHKLGTLMYDSLYVLEKLQILSLPQLLSSVKYLETLSIKADNDSPCLVEEGHGLNINSLDLSGGLRCLNPNDIELLRQSTLSRKQLETLDGVNTDRPNLWDTLHGLNIKSLKLRARFGCTNMNNLESLSQSLSSLKQLKTLSIEQDYDIPCLWKALHGLQITSLTFSLRVGCLKSLESLSQSLSSLKQLKTLSIEQDYDIPCLWKALHGLQITSLTFSFRVGCLKSKSVESLLLLTQLETLTIYVPTYNEILLPKTLKYFNIYCFELQPSQLRDLVHTLHACIQTIEIRLEFGCAQYTYDKRQIQLDEYIFIKQELETRKNVTVKRLQIFLRIPTTLLEDTWSVPDIDNNQDDDNVNDGAYLRIFCREVDCISRISIRLLITPAVL